MSETTTPTGAACPICREPVISYELGYGYDSESRPLPDQNRWTFQPCGDRLVGHFDDRLMARAIWEARQADAPKS
jgi:hypothetical protein